MVVVGACADGCVRVWAGVPLEGSTAALNVPCDERRLHTASINFVALAEVDGRPVLVTGDAMGQVSSQFVWNFLPKVALWLFTSSETGPVRIQLTSRSNAEGAWCRHDLQATFGCGQ